MDRKAWIIVCCCIAIIGANFYYSSENSKIAEDARQREAAVQQAARKAEEADRKATAAPAENQADKNNSKAGLIVPPPPVNADAKTWDVVVKRDKDGKEISVTKFIYTNIGGAIRSVEMIDSPIDSHKVADVDVQINPSGETRGIGNLVFGMGASADPVFDDTVYARHDEGQDPSTVRFVGKTADGLAILKEYSLSHIIGEDGKPLAGGDYMVRLKITIENATDRPIRIPDMGIFAGASYPISKNEQKDVFTHYFYRQDGEFLQESPAYFTDGWFSNAKPREFVTKKDISYAGVMNQYYVTALIPQANSQGDTIFARRQLFHLNHEGDAEVPGVILAMGTPVIDLNPGQQRILEYDIYAGPKLYQVLSDLPGDLGEIMAYGWFTFLSVPMNWLLNFFHGLVGNWGVAIILMTIVVRICIWPLHKKSYMSMKRMSLVQPKIQELKEKYGSDQQKMSQEMMKLYKDYGINPLSGCLPMLIQIPIFFAFYRVLQYSAELRGQPFFLWVHDLSLPDTVFNLPFAIGPFTHIPINILPLLMAVTMIIQMKMTPQAGDKMQQRIMAFMPWMFFLFCYNFASALALYWTTQNLISMGQTALIRRLPQPELTKTSGSKKQGFFQRLMEQQRVAMEQKQRSAGQGKGGNMRNVTPKKK